MNLYEAEEKDEMIDSIIKMVEKDTKKTIFTIKILDRVQKGFETLIVFEDKEVMVGMISIETIDERMAVRLQGNFI